MWIVKKEILEEIITAMSINEIQCLKEEELNTKITGSVERKKAVSTKYDKNRVIPRDKQTTQKRAIHK